MQAMSNVLRGSQICIGFRVNTTAQREASDKLSFNVSEGTNLLFLLGATLLARLLSLLCYERGRLEVRTGLGVRCRTTLIRSQGDVKDFFIF